MLLIVLQVRDYLSKNFSSSLQCRCSRKMRPFRIFHILKSWLNLILPYLCKGAPKIQVAFGNKLQTLTLLLFVDSRMDVKTIITVLFTFSMMIKEQLALNLQGMTCIFLLKVFRLSTRLYFLYPAGLNFCVACLNSFSKGKMFFVTLEVTSIWKPCYSCSCSSSINLLTKKKWCFHVFSKASWVEFKNDDLKRPWHIFFSNIHEAERYLELA